MPAPDEADDSAPIEMAIHDADQEFWFRHVEVRDIFFLSHKFRGMVFIPRSLRLIENRDVLYRLCVRHKIGVPKMMNVLDERPHFACSVRSLYWVACQKRPRLFIARKCFS